MLKPSFFKKTPRQIVFIVTVLAVSAATFVTRAATPDDYGNKFESASEITLDSSGNGNQAGIINPAKDNDLFKLRANFDGSLRIRLSATEGSTLDSTLIVLNEKQERIAKNENSEGSQDAEVILEVTAGTNYYLRATGTATTSGAYKLSIETVKRTLGLGKKPNIVLIVTDDQSYRSLEKMPYVTSRTDWNKFEKAFIHNSTCCPSRATILTGQWSHHHGVEATGGAPRFDDRSTLATWLNDAGYRTGLFGKYHLGNVNETKIENYIPPGWDEWYGWHGITGSEAYYNYTLNENGKLVSYGSKPEDYSTDVLAGKAVDFINRADSSNPFFLYFVPRGPHNPWIAAPRHIGAHAKLAIPKPPNYNEADVSDKPAWVRELPMRKPSNTDGAQRKEYDTLLSVDEAVRSIMQALDAKGMTDDTVVIFMTDNAYAYGEHRHLDKICAYEECNHTPLLVLYPKKGHSPRSISEVVSNADIAPTLAELAGITPGAPVDGRSFLRLLEGDTTGWENAVLLRGYHSNDEANTVPTFWGIRTDKYKYVEYVNSGEVELYDLAADPYEMDSQHNNPSFAVIRAHLASKLTAMRTAAPH